MQADGNHRAPFLPEFSTQLQDRTQGHAAVIIHPYSSHGVSPQLIENSDATLENVGVGKSGLTLIFILQLIYILPLLHLFDSYQMTVITMCVLQTGVRSKLASTIVATRYI